MIYILGDSYSYGWNFYVEKNSDRKQLVYGSHLSKMFDTDYKNLSIAGGSNNRIARLLINLDLTPDDIVVIAWTELSRLEIGIPNDRVVPKDKIIQHDEIDFLEEKNLEFDASYQIIEKNKNLLTRNVWNGLHYSLQDISNPSFREFIVSYYKNAGNDLYFEEIFKMLYYATLYKLKSSGCKFCMFTTFSTPINDKNYMNIPEFIFPESNMTDEIRKGKKPNDKYWSKEEHRTVAEIIYNHLQKENLYDIQ